MTTPWISSIRPTVLASEVFVSGVSVVAIGCVS
jgi:hypothetical protein